MNRLRLMAFLVSSWAALGSVSSNAATVDGQPSFDRSKDKGIYVWRQGADSNTWQIRQVSGGSNGDSFDGRFESSGSLGSLKKVALDSPDSAVVSSGNTLTVEFNVKNTDVDGAKFDIGSGSELCLRSLGGETTVFLGENAIPAQTPVALQGADACPSTADPAGDGLYISQDNSGRWMVRLTSNEATAKFAGQFEATQPFDSVNPISIENNDEVALQSPDT